MAQGLVDHRLHGTKNNPPVAARCGSSSTQRNDGTKALPDGRFWGLQDPTRLARWAVPRIRTSRVGGCRNWTVCKRTLWNHYMWRANDMLREDQHGWFPTIPSGGASNMYIRHKEDPVSRIFVVLMQNRLRNFSFLLSWLVHCVRTPWQTTVG